MRVLSAAVVVLVVWWGLRPKRPAGPYRPITSTASEPVTRLSGCGDRIIRVNGVGKVRIGMSVDSLKQQCHVVIDRVTRGIEGTDERRLTVAFPPDFIEAEIVDGRVWRLDVESPAFRTPDSVGVGSSVAELLRRDDPDGGVGEGAFYLISRKHCGLSYRLSGGLHVGATRRWDRKALSTLPASLEVSKVLVWDCKRSWTALDVDGRTTGPSRF